MNRVPKEELADFYHKHSNKETAEFLGCSLSQLRRELKALQIPSKVAYKPKQRKVDGISALLKRISAEAFIDDFYQMMQDDLAVKYGLTIRQIRNLKEYFNLNDRRKQLADYKIDVDELADYYSSHTLQATKERFGISNLATLKNLLKYYNIPIERRQGDDCVELAKRISREELEAYYKTHTLKETAAHFGIRGNLRHFLTYYNIPLKTKSHEDFKAVLNRINGEQFKADYANMGIYDLFVKYDIIYTTYRKLIKHFDLGYKPQIFSAEAGVSKGEDEVYGYICSLIGVDNVIRNDRNILKYGLGLDLYIPKFKLGIEFNGTYRHSDLQRPKNYHFEKSKLAKACGIRLIHIWEYEWQDPAMRAKLEQLLNIVFGNNITKIYARHCEVKRISNAEARPFNEQTHLQGHRNAQVTYGLFYKGKLVQLMSFSRTRYNKNLLSENDWEIIRGCPGSNNIVVGGVSRLFKHFVQEQHPASVFSYCDFNKFNGKSYEELGMSFMGYTGPDMKYYLNSGEVVNRSPKNYRYNNENCKFRLFGAGSLKYKIVFQDSGGQQADGLREVNLWRQE